MPKSPRTSALGPLDISVESDGDPVPEARLIAVTVTRAINRIPCARIVLMDGDVAEQDFALSESDTFKPGAEITIKAGYDGDNQQIFEGIVVRHRLRIDAEHGGRLVIDCRDKAYAMTLDRKNANYVDKKDSDVIESLINNYAGLKANVAGTSISYGEQVQYYCSDWDFMLMRAEVNGLVVVVDDADVEIGAPNVDGSAVLQVTCGEDIIDFDADIDGRTQLQSVETAAWDLANQKMESASAKPKELNDQGDIGGSALAADVGPEIYRMQTPATLSKEALDEWAKARQLKAGLARIRGKVTFQGNADAKVGSLIELVGVGNRFEGKVYVSRIEHKIESGDWLTHAEFGLAADWFVENNDVIAPPAAGWIPGVSGLHVGIVKKLDEDPEKQHRVQVSVPVLGDSAEGVWARLGSYYASNGFGAFFVPEIDDEVVLGFMNDNPSQPVVLGSLYSSKRPPADPYKLEAENNLKSLVTRSKLKLEFDDEKKIVTILTPAGNEFVLSEDDQSITLNDQNDNSMVMNSDGVALDSSKDISINAKGNISIDAMGKIDVSAKQDVGIKGANVNQEAQLGFTAKGNASAELSAAGQTTVKGAMVMIN